MPADDDELDDELEELLELEDDDELEALQRRLEKHLRAATATAARIRLLLEEL